MADNNGANKSLESWIWDAACSIRGAKDAAKYKDFILPLIFTKRLCDVFDDELNRIAQEVGSRAKAFKLVKRDKKLVRFYLPKITTILDTISHKQRVARQKKTLLTDLFRTLLHQLMTAQIRVHDLDLSELELEHAQIG